MEGRHPLERRHPWKADTRGRHLPLRPIQNARKLTIGHLMRRLIVRMVLLLLQRNLQS